MYTLLQSPIPTTSGFAPHMSDSSFKPIQPAAPSTAPRLDTLGSANTLLNMVDNSQGTGLSPANSIPCAQKSPEQQTSQTSTGTSTHSHNLHNTLWQNIAQGQPPATNQQASKQSPVAHQQQSSLLRPPAPGSCAASGHQGWPQFIQPMVSPQCQPSRQPGQPSPFRQTFNPSAQPFIPAAEAQQNNAVPNPQELKVPKSADGKDVKNGGPDSRLCFRCGQPGHLKKDCPLSPYCSCCDTRGHTPVNCPNKRRQQQNKTHESENRQPEERCRNWKRAQDQPQYSNPENKCLHCTGNHRSCDCLTRHQH